MNNIKLKNQFNKMGYAIILNIVIMAIFYFWWMAKINDGEYYSPLKLEKELRIGIIIASAVELGFVIWYISWWFITASCFYPPNHIENEVVEKKFKKKSLANKIGVFLFSFVIGSIALIGVGVSGITWKLADYIDPSWGEDINLFPLYIVLPSVIIFNLVSILSLFLLNKKRIDRYFHSIIFGFLTLSFSTFRLIAMDINLIFVWLIFMVANACSTCLPYYIQYKTVKLNKSN